jgi:CDGSH-type Zn-finger protein
VETREVVIVPYQDGPYLVRGPVELRDQDGRRIVLGRRTIALCRCGKSRMRPFCDGTHRLVRFQAPSQPEQARPADSDPTVSPRRNGTVRSATPERSRLEAGSGTERSQVEAGSATEAARVRHALSELIAATHELPGDEELAHLVEQLAALVIVLQARLQPA